MTDQELIAYLKRQGLDKDVAAADRIEELMMETARLDAGWHKANVRALDLGMKALDTKLKLSKVMEALREIEADCDADYPPSHGAIKYAIRAVLAELEE